MTLTRADLLPWQREAVDFLKLPLPVSKNPHKGLWDEPGLGKTPEMCVTLAELAVTSALVICPDPIAVKQSWADHLVDWGVCGADDIHILRNTTDTIPVDARFVICGWALLNYKEIYRQLYFSRWHALVMDEGHRAKEWKSKRTKQLFAKPDPLIERCGYKFDVTGTPMPNRSMELWARLRSMAEEVIAPHVEYHQFGNYFCGGLLDENGDYRGNSHTPELAKRLETYAIRRRMEDVFEYVPEVSEYQLFVDIGDLPSGANETNTPQATLRKEIGIAMVPYVVEYLQHALQSGEKVLCFTYHREVSETVHAAFGTRAELLYGGMSPERKDAAKNRFIEDGSCDLLVAQLNCAGEAVDGLQRVCNTIVRAEPDWSGGVHVQNVGRLKRFHQTKPVSDTLLLARNGNLPMLTEIIANVRRRKVRIMHEMLDNYKQKREELTMPLETDIQALTAAVKALTEVMQAAEGTDGDTGKKKGRGKSAAQDVNTAAPGAQTPTTPATAGTPASEVPNAQAAQNALAAVSSQGTVAGVPSEDEVRAAASAYKLALQTNGSTDEAATGELVKVIQMLGAANVAGLQPTLRAAAIANFNALAAATKPVAATNGLGI